MASEPFANSDLENAFQDIIRIIPPKVWDRFAESALRLNPQKMSDIKSRFTNDEMKYQMLLAWQEQTGTAASAETINAVRYHFHYPDEYPDPNLSIHTTPSSEHRDNDILPADYCANVESVEVRNTELSFYNTNRQKGSNYSRKGKGRTLIVNNRFNHLEETSGRRIGSEKDLKIMKELWEQLGSIVIVRENLTADSMKEELKEFAFESGGCDFCVVFIMSHGDCENAKEFINGNDHGKVYVDDVIEMFNNIKSDHLQGIPKLFFFQCCRGGGSDLGAPLRDSASGNEMPTTREDGNALPEVMPGVSTATSVINDASVLGSISAEEFLSRSIVVNTDAMPEALAFDATLRGPNTASVPSAGPSAPMIPLLTDILISHATRPGCQAFLNTAYGSWFVRAIANVFMRLAKSEHVADLMTFVREAVSTQSVSQDGSMTMPEAKTILCKKLFFYPGIEFCQNNAS